MIETAKCVADDTALVKMGRSEYLRIMVNSRECERGQKTKRRATAFESKPDRMRMIFQKPSENRTPFDLKFAAEYLSGIKFFAGFENEVRQELCAAMNMITAWTGTYLFHEGNKGNHFYILFSGLTYLYTKCVIYVFGG